MRSISHPPSSPSRHRQGFTLVEIITVIAVIVILVSISASVIGNTGATALKTAGETLTASVEQGRTAAITRRREVALAVLEPGKGGFDDGQVRLGLFELEGETDAGALKGTLLKRWTKLPGGIAFFGGEVDSLDNLVDQEPITIEWKDGNESAQMHTLIFTARGGLSRPRGSESVVVTIGRGTYANGSVKKFGKGANRTLRIGRVVARPWILDV
ncbi:MAG: prepilin-type N-terminal cleavage/methylation domain-containing protein [Verrucomicrobiota bacterium]